MSGATCSKLFRPPNPENLMLGERFVSDQTGDKRLPYSGRTPFPSGRMFEDRAVRYCDDNSVWFVAGHEELGKTMITKYSASGDLLYNIRMTDPKFSDNKLARRMIPYSLAAEDGYIYFYWEQDIAGLKGDSRVRISKLRFREPTHVQ